MDTHRRRPKSRAEFIALPGLVLLAALTALASFGGSGEAATAVAAAACEPVCLVPPRAAGVLHVDWEATGAGDGSSWDDAFVDLQLALDAARPGDDIWVASGTYYPSVEHGGSGDRYKSFQMLNEVGIYGGFDPSVGDMGWEDRDWEANVAILSGEIGLAGDPSDNCYHVFFHPDGTDLDGSAILDGLTVAGGNAEGSWDHDNGGGMYNDGSAPTLANCTFSGNSASKEGGALYNAHASPALSHCAFVDNAAGWYGGAVCNIDASPALTNCSFVGNSAGYFGGAMHNSSASQPALSGCTFEANSASDGGGMYNTGPFSSPALTDCHFENNRAGGHGGGMRNYEASPSLIDCTFVGNTANQGGGIASTRYGSTSVTNSRFLGNTAAYGGGLYDSSGCTTTVTNCVFAGNSATEEGGGVHSYSSSPELVNCTLSGNSAGTYGGGMHNYRASPVVTNCTFSGNTALQGGGMGNLQSGPVVTNCTFSGNRAVQAGGGLGNIYSGPVVTNSILWADTPNEIHDWGGLTDATYSDIQGGYEGEGNIDADPLFVDPGSGDFHLAGGSPCIDTGTNDAPLLPAYDFEGDDRILDGNGDGTAVVDMGVDEVSTQASVYLPLVVRSAP